MRAILTLPPDEAATALAAATAEAVERGLPPPKSPLSAGALDFAIVDEVRAARRRGGVIVGNQYAPGGRGWGHSCSGIGTSGREVW